jgi:exodeoxyribonuclease-1
MLHWIEMASTFFFYDLETSGIDPRTARIMQFAGQRTDEDFNPIGEPYNILIKLSDDVLPEPDALMVTCITPQQTLQDGINEAEFFKLFTSEIACRDTVFVGFNNVRFDDEFIRFGLYRNFYDSYEWCWKDNCSRWDLLDVVRMTRALRPEGIKWPFAPDGKPTNRLEMITSLNGLDHENAHDALNDVLATIAIARLIKSKQPKLFNYLFDMRNKKKVTALVNRPEPFVYVSGKYAAEFEKASVVTVLGSHPDKQGVLVYDLRHDPGQFLNMQPEELAAIWKYSKDPETLRLPVKTLQFNRCPAVAPLGVLSEENKQRLQIDLATIRKHEQLLKAHDQFIDNLHKALKILNAERADQATLFSDEKTVDAKLYDGFIGDQDKQIARQFVESTPDQLETYQFNDERLKLLAPLYKARNYPESLNSEERSKWDQFRANILKKRLPNFSARFQACSERADLTKNQQFVLEELRLYVESIMPESD